jgi:hypothetical protein
LPSNPGFKVTKDGGLIIHPQLATANDQGIQIPQVDSAYGAGFGDSITDQDRAFAVSREPICHFLTFVVAADMIDKWFTIDDPDTEEADPALDRSVQAVFSELKFKRQLRKAVESARTYGRALLVGGFNDAKSVADLAKPKALNAKLLQLAVYPETYQQQKVKEFTVNSIDVDPISPRYGLPVTYKLTRASLNESGQQTSDTLIIHWSRVCEVGDGTSVLDKIWDDMTCGRNIRWGAAQYMFRVGGAFPVLSFPAGTSAAQLEAWGASGAFTNLMSRTYILLAQNSTTENDGMTFEFKGAAGSTLDPAPFYTQNIQQIAIATGYPQAKLIGAQAGAVTGSEVNQQEYYKAISRDQEAYCEEPIRWVINCLSESGQIGLIRTSAATDKQTPSYHLKLLKATLKRALKRDYRHKVTEQYTITWNSAFEMSEKDEAQIEYTHAQAQSQKLGWMSKDEIRAEEGLDPLPNGAGEWKDQTDMFGGEEFLVKTNQKMKPKDERKPTAENPKDNPDNPSDNRQKLDS